MTTYDRLKRAAERAGTSVDAPDAPFEGDSLDFLLLIQKVEEEFGIELSVWALGKRRVNTPRELVAYVDECGL